MFLGVYLNKLFWLGNNDNVEIMKWWSGVELGVIEFKLVYVINCVINFINVKFWSDEFNVWYIMFFLGRVNCYVFCGKFLDLEICFNLNIYFFKKNFDDF